MDSKPGSESPTIKTMLLRGTGSWFIALVICLMVLLSLGFSSEAWLLCGVMGGPVIVLLLVGLKLPEYWLLAISLVAFVGFQRLPRPMVWCSAWTSIGLGILWWAVASGGFS